MEHFGKALAFWMGVNYMLLAYQVPTKTKHRSNVRQ